MLKKTQRILALARNIMLDSLRRHALLGLVLLAVAAQATGLFFFDFISRDIGRASSDFIFSIIWLAGFVFLFFHAVQVIAWDEERRTIYALLARPISRGEYVLGIFIGLAGLLLLLNLLLGALGWPTLLVINNKVAPEYFGHLSTSYYLLTWLGLFALELMILSVIMLFSGLVRGNFPVLLLSMAYYAICTGLPVVRQSVAFEIAYAKGDVAGLRSVLKLLEIMTAVFPDFDRLDFKNFTVSTDALPAASLLLTNFGLAAAYVVVILWLACAVYQRRDLQ